MEAPLGGRFELLAEAARGGMGSVHRARDLRTGQLVAVKLLDQSPQFDRVRFEREAALLAAIRHPNIVRYVTHGVHTDGTRFLVQEWVDGVTLSTQLATIGLSARDAVKVAIGLGDALDAVHRARIIHRDVKPANVILDEGDPERVKLVDFGIARLEADSGVLTRAGILVGTPSYMSPEQARGSVEITPASDVWSAGCVLYEALAGRKAFGGRTPEAIRAKVLMSTPPSPDEVCPEIDPALARVVDTALSKAPMDRFATGGDFAEALRGLLITMRDHPPRRANNDPKPRTVVQGARSKAFALVTIAPGASAAAHSLDGIVAISARRHLRVHRVDEGTLLLEASEGAEGAMEAAYAALEVQEEIGDGAVSVFAQALDESLGDAIDRGADQLSSATVVTMFASAVEGEPLVPVDDVVGEMIRDGGLDVVSTDFGRALRARTHP